MEKFSVYSETSSYEVSTNVPPTIARYLDMHGHVISWPAKRATRHLLFVYLSSFFEEEHIYSEKEVNEVLSVSASVVDYATLRRDLCDFQYLKRTRDGSQYWRAKRNELTSNSSQKINSTTSQAASTVE